MRKFILSAAIATIAAVSFAAPSQAGGYGWGHGGGHGWGHGWGHRHHDGYVRVYDDYQPHCFFKKIKKWDKWGNLHIKKVKICR